MKRNSLGTMAAAVACLGIIVPPSAFAGPPVASSPDVALRSGGMLVGQVVDTQGVAKANALVSVRQGEHEVVRTRTDENGVFAAQGLRGGTYQLLTQDGSCACRLWAADTAPPAARPAALLVSGNEVVRGMYGADGMIGWAKAHPYITIAAVAAGTAIPLAFIDHDNGNGS